MSAPPQHTGGRLALAAVLTALAAAGCSGGGGSAQSSPASDTGTPTGGQPASAAACSAPPSGDIGASPTSGQDFSTSEPDASALALSDGESRSLTGGTVTKTGDSSSEDQSSFTGLNAAVLAPGGARLGLSGTTITSTGTGANAVFATGTGSLIQLQDVTITAGGSLAHAVMATAGAAVTGANLTMETTGERSSAVATDRGGGEITLANATARTSGERSALVYSTGQITACNLSGASGAAEAVVVEGANAAAVTASDLTGATAGARLYSSTPGGTGGGSFSMTGGTLTARSGDAVLIEGVSGQVNLSNQAQLQADAGILIHATQGAQGSANLSETTLTGPVGADATSSLDLSLTADSVIEGTLDNVGLTLDNTSSIRLDADSTATTVAGALVSGNRISNITGNGHTLTYDPSASGNSYLAGRSYDLQGGGTLQPAAETGEGG